MENNNSKISVKEWRQELTNNIDQLTKTTSKIDKRLVKVEINLGNHLTKHEKADELETIYENKLSILRKSHRFQLILAILGPTAGGVVAYFIIKAIG